MHKSCFSLSAAFPPDAHTPPSPRYRASQRRPRALGDDPIAQSIKRNIEQGRSELRLAGKDAEGRLSCAVHLRRAFRKRRKNLGAIRVNGDGAEHFVVGRCPCVVDSYAFRRQHMVVMCGLVEESFSIPVRQFNVTGCWRGRRAA